MHQDNRQDCNLAFGLCHVAPLTSCPEDDLNIRPMKQLLRNDELSLDSVIAGGGEVLDTSLDPWPADSLCCNPRVKEKPIHPGPQHHLYMIKKPRKSKKNAMKKLSMIVSLCLAFGIGFAQLSAQATSDWTMSAFWSPVFCDGEMVDLLQGGEIRVHIVTHSNYYQTDIYQNIQIKGKVTSDVTGEVFTIRETDKVFKEDGIWYYTWKYNLKGNKGTHYIGTLTQPYFGGPIEVGKTVCH